MRLFPDRSSRLAIYLVVVLTIAVWLNVQGSSAMKKKMLRKLKNMLSMGKSKKMIILPIPIPMMMDDKKMGMLNLMSSHMMPTMNQGMDWMMMSMMDCPDMGSHMNMGSGGYEGGYGHGHKPGKTSVPMISSGFRPIKPSGSGGHGGWSSSGGHMNKPHQQMQHDQGSGDHPQQISQTKY